jgi:hypothetical protein
MGVFLVDKVALGQVFPEVLRFFPVSFILPLLHYTEKRKKLVIFSTRLQNKPQGCGAAVHPLRGILYSPNFVGLTLNALRAIQFTPQIKARLLCADCYKTHKCQKK